MIFKYAFGRPFKTDAVIKSFPLVNSLPDYIEMSQDKNPLLQNLE